MADVFVSYSRKDKEFAQILHDALENSQQKTWVDWKDILPTSERWHETERAIEGADTFIFVISPDSIISEYCGKEIEHADRLNKRILPIVRRDVMGSEGDIHPALSRHQWIFFRESNDFNIAFQRLIEAIAIDIAHIHAHTRLLVRAIEWNDKGRKDGFLLRGEDLQDGEIWLANGAGKDPQPTELQGTYIKISREIEEANNWAAANLQEAVKKAALRTKIGSAILAGTILLAVVAGVSATEFVNEANVNKTEKAAKDKLTNADMAVVTAQKKADDISSVWSVAFSPDGKTIATGNSDNTVKLWNLEGKELQSFKGHSSSVRSVAFSPDGKTIATGSFDNTVKLWNLQGKELQSFKGHSSGVSSIAFSPDGKTIASGSSDNTVKLWKVKSR